MFSFKQQSKDKGKAVAAGAAAGGAAPAPRLRAGQLRAQKDITDIDMPPSMALSFPNGASDMMHLGLSLSPPEGPYHPGTFHFSISIPDGYPHSPPKVHCDTKVFHPNIDLEGHVCLNILRQDWKPVLTLSAVLYGLQLLFLEPNADDPLNSEAADALKAGGVAWERLVAKTLRGGYVGGTRFDKVV
ncbi:hypothetical protein MMPV_004730 [Pyropia vietnamensis]